MRTGAAPLFAVPLFGRWAVLAAVRAEAVSAPNITPFGHTMAAQAWEADAGIGRRRAQARADLFFLR